MPICWRTYSGGACRFPVRFVLLFLIVSGCLLGLTALPAGAAPQASNPNAIAAARVAADGGLNMRGSPQMGSTVLRVLPFLTELLVIGQVLERDGHKWIPVRLTAAQGGQSGWASQRWLVAFPLERSSAHNGRGLLNDPQRLRLIKGSGDAQYAALVIITELVS